MVFRNLNATLQSAAEIAVEIQWNLAGASNLPNANSFLRNLYDAVYCMILILG